MWLWLTGSEVSAGCTCTAAALRVSQLQAACCRPGRQALLVLVLVLVLHVLPRGAHFSSVSEAHAASSSVCHLWNWLLFCSTASSSVPL
jgi:hypothetical protein